MFAVDVQFQGKILFDGFGSLVIKRYVVDIVIFRHVVVFQVADEIGMSFLKCCLLYGAFFVADVEA